jgi:hypothetical protein
VFAEDRPDPLIAVLQPDVTLPPGP